MAFLNVFSDQKKILLVDSNLSFAEPFKAFLTDQGFDVKICASSTALLVALKNELPDIVLVDLILNSKEGLDLTQLTRSYFAGPVIILSDHQDDKRQIKLLNDGLDDFLCKDMSTHLLLARINARLRGAAGTLGDDSSQKRLIFGDLVIDNAVREAWLKDSPIELTGAEFDLLWLLSSHAGQIMTREEIFHRLRGIEYDGQDRSVDVRVSRIRPKVGDDPDHPRRIKTIRSKGYLFVAENVSLEPGFIH